MTTEGMGEGMTDNLERYLAQDRPRFRDRDLDILRKFVARVEGGLTHKKAHAAVCREVGPYASSQVVYGATKLWREAHPEEAAGGTSRLLLEAVIELADSLGCIEERTPAALFAWVERRKAERVRPMLPPEEQRQA